MILVGNGTVVTMDDENPLIESGAVLIDGPVIKAVGKEAELRLLAPESSFVDARGGLILPGLINCHTHIYSGLARGLSIAGNHPKTFVDILEGTWWAIDRHLTIPETKACAYATLLECIRNGVTTIFDHHAGFGAIEGSLFAIRDVCQEMGERACLCYEVSERDGMDKCRASIQENADFIDWAEKDRSGMFAAMFGGHALFTISDATFEQMVEANHGRTGFHIHVCEGMNDVYDSVRNYGCHPIERLSYNGILGPKTLLAHCIHVSPREMDLIKETGTMVVNNPQSNMNNAVGMAPALQLLHRGITVGMGTDAYLHDMLESLKTFILIQRHEAADPDIGFAEDMEMLFSNNRKIASLYFDKPLGILKEGAAADVITMDYHPFTPFTADNIYGHILFGLTGRDTRNTIVNGKVLYQDRTFVTVDEEKINAFCREEAGKLWGELNH